MYVVIKSSVVQIEFRNPNDKRGLNYTRNNASIKQRAVAITSDTGMHVHFYLAIPAATQINCEVMSRFDYLRWQFQL